MGQPATADPGFSPRAGGMSATLPYCDAFLPAHTFAALRDVIGAVTAGARTWPASRG